MTDEETVRSFFEELDRRIRGTSGTHSAASRQRLRLLRPRLRRQAEEDPEGFAQRLHHVAGPMFARDRD